MTREEVINGLYDIKNWKCNGDAEMYKTIVEAIQALKQSEPCEDAVSRKDAIIQLSHNKNGDPDCDVIIQHDIETLKRLPSVTPKRKE